MMAYREGSVVYRICGMEANLLRLQCFDVTRQIGSERRKIFLPVGAWLLNFYGSVNGSTPIWICTYFPPLVAMALLLLLTMLIRYFFASTIACVVTLVPVIFILGQVFGLPAIPLLLLVAASAQLASLMTHYGNAVGPLLFGAGYVPESRWWFTGHIIAFYSMAVYFVVGLAWWSVLGLW